MLPGGAEIGVLLEVKDQSSETNWRMVEVVLSISFQMDERLCNHAVFTTAHNDANRPQIDE